MFLSDFFYPRTCVNCHYLGTYLCPKCLTKLLYLKDQRCFYCQRPSRYGLTHPGCKKNPEIDGIISLFHYEPILKKIIHQFKYGLATLVFNEFFNSINWFEHYQYYRHWLKNTYLQPIPLHHQRLAQRGFNQALLIAQKINNYLNLPWGNFLTRKINTKPQVSFKDKSFRLNNLRGAFELGVLPPFGAGVLLVDDVITTGATLKSAAQILKITGRIKKIYAFTLARG